MGLLPLTSLALLPLLAACSDSSSNRGSPEVPLPPERISISTPNAERCEILDSDNCLFPWPSDALTVEDGEADTGRRVNLAQASLPANRQGVRVDPAEWNRNDGFSPSQMILTQVPGLDLEQSAVPPITDLSRSLEPEATVMVIRASTGEPHLIFGELDAITEDPAEQTFIIRPMVQFERGERYIVVLRNLRDAEGNRLEAPPVFRAFRDNTLTDNDAIEARRPAMDSLFAELTAVGIERDEVYLAWDFTVASARTITERILHIRDEGFALLGGAAPEYSISSQTDFAPCSESGCQASGARHRARSPSGQQSLRGAGTRAGVGSLPAPC